MRVDEDECEPRISTFDRKMCVRGLPYFNGKDFRRFKIILKEYIKDCADNEDHLKQLRRIVLEKLLGRSFYIAIQCDSPTEILEVLEEKYTENNAASDVMKEIENLTMNTYTSVSDYNDAVDEKAIEYLALESYENADLRGRQTQMTQDLLIQKYYNGLSRQIQNRIEVRNLKSCNQTKSEAFAEERDLNSMNKYVRNTELSQVLEKLDKLTARETVNTSEKRTYCAICKINEHDTDDCKRNSNNITCKKCGKIGHYARFCQSRTSENRNINKNNDNSISNQSNRNNNNSNRNTNYRGYNNTRGNLRNKSGNDSKKNTTHREMAKPCAICSTEEHESKNCPKLLLFRAVLNP